MFIAYNNRYNDLQKIIKDSFKEDYEIFNLLYCLPQGDNNSIVVGLMLDKAYYGINKKTKRYVQIEFINDQIELNIAHLDELRKNFFDKYQNELLYLAKFIEEKQYEKKVEIVTVVKDLSLIIRMDKFELIFDNEIRLIHTFNECSEENDNIYNNFDIKTSNNKISKFIRKGSLTIEELLKKIKVKKDIIPAFIQEDINQSYNTKKIKNLQKK